MVNVRRHRHMLVFALAAAALIAVPPAGSMGLGPSSPVGNVEASAALPAWVGPGAFGELPMGADGASCAAKDPVPAQLERLGIAKFNLEPGAGAWRTWTVGTDDIAVPPPPDTLSAQTVAELAELQQIAMNRTEQMILDAQQVDDGPAHKYWTEFYMATIVEHASKTGKRNPPRLSREMAIVHTAMYDALVIAWDAKYCYKRAAPSLLLPTIQPVVAVREVPSYPSEHAVVAGVMSALLPKLFSWVTDEICYAPEPPAHPADCEEDPDLLEAATLRAAYSRLAAGTNYRSDVEAGLQLGRAVGNAVWNDRLNDGSNAAPTRPRISDSPCNWVPTPPAFRKNPLEPQWGDVRTWIMSGGSQFRSPPPPACDSQQYIGQYADIYYTTGWNGTNLNQRQKDIAKYWEGGQGTVTPPGISTWEASNITVEEGLNTMRAARVMSYIGVAVADAAIAVWDTKFHYWYDRPVTAIQRLGHAGVLPEDAKTWIPYLNTPPFPGYISGHSGFSAAAYFTLGHFFPEREPEFRAKSTEAAQSRFYGGIHFAADNERGIEVGLGINGLLEERARSDGAEV